MIAEDCRRKEVGNVGELHPQLGATTSGDLDRVRQRRDRTPRGASRSGEPAEHRRSPEYFQTGNGARCGAARGDEGQRGQTARHLHAQRHSLGIANAHSKPATAPRIAARAATNHEPRLNRDWCAGQEPTAAETGPTPRDSPSREQQMTYKQPTVLQRRRHGQRSRDRAGALTRPTRRIASDALIASSAKPTEKSAARGSLVQDRTARNRL